jgi:hypothetical protein
VTVAAVLLDVLTIALGVTGPLSLAHGGGAGAAVWSVTKLLCLAGVLAVASRRHAAPRLLALLAIPAAILVVSGPGLHRDVGRGLLARLPGVPWLSEWLRVGPEAVGTFVALAAAAIGGIALCAVVGRALGGPARAVSLVLGAGLLALLLVAGGLDLLAAVRQSATIAAVEQATERLVLSATLGGVTAAALARRRPREQGRAAGQATPPEAVASPAARRGRPRR